MKWRDLALMRGDLGSATLNVSLVDEDSDAVSPVQVAALRSVISHLRGERWEAIPASARHDRVLIEMMTSDREAYSVLEPSVKELLTVVEGTRLACLGGLSPSVRDIDSSELRRLSRILTVRVHGAQAPLATVTRALSVDTEGI